jgi:hypothetical protein
MPANPKSKIQNPKCAGAVILIVLLGLPVAAWGQDPFRAEELAAARRFDEAEREYRRALGARPQDWRLRLGLARVILWDGRYREAERAFAAMLDERPRDVDALLGYAQAAYWSGDFRSARNRYERLREADPANAEAIKALSDIALLSAPRYEVTATHRDDSQPYRVSMMRAQFSYFSDPLVRWDVVGGTGDVSDGESRIATVGAGVSAAFPRLRSTVEGRLERFRFPDGFHAAIGEVAVTRDLPGHSKLGLSARKTPLLGTASSVAHHETTTQLSVSWRRDPAARWLAAVSAQVLDYSDGNSGTGADAWVVAPVFSRGTFMLRAGLSGAWRDTELDRFRFTTFRSEQESPGVWRYTYTGVYDPYWTPHELKEARVVVVAEIPRLKIHADAGYARDRALGFGPRTGSTPTPLFIDPQMQGRSFRPWRAGAELHWPIAARIDVRARYVHEVTAFYRANEFEASLGGRL